MDSPIQLENHRNAQHREIWQTLQGGDRLNYTRKKIIHQRHEQLKSPTKCNTSFLPSELKYRLAGDLLVAGGITFGFAPFISVIDKAIVKHAAGSHSLLQSSQESLRGMVRNPVAFVKSPAFLMVWGVYAITYGTANCLKTYTEYQDSFHGGNNSSQNNGNSSNVGVNLSNFALTAAVNSSLQLRKDVYYASRFGMRNICTMPIRSYSMWVLRDCTIIGSSFILPEIMGKVLEDRMDINRATALQISQFTCPIAAQAVATPLQLLGLDFYNRTLPGLSYSNAAISRFQFQHATFKSILGVRILKMTFAFSLCGIGNTYVRDCWREGMLRQERNANSTNNELINSIGIINNSTTI